MKFIGSSIGKNDWVLLNDINYFSVPGASFTPGVGGTYKQDAPPSLNVNSEEDGDKEGEEKVGCELARSAGWGTPAWCSTTTCNLNRPYLPERIIDPGRLDYMIAALKEKEMKERSHRIVSSESLGRLLVALGIFSGLCILFKPRK